MSLRCLINDLIYVFDIYIYIYIYIFEVITLIKLVNTSFTAHNYQGFCLVVIMVSIFKVCTPSHSPMKSTVLLTNRQDQLRGTQSKIIGI